MGSNPVRGADVYECFCCPILVEILRLTDPTSKENYQMRSNKIQKPGELGSSKPRLADVRAHRHES
jgi:hypothetical protein